VLVTVSERACIKSSVCFPLRITILDGTRHERLFSPCTRLRERFESQGRVVGHELLQELELDVSTAEFLSTERMFAYADLYAVLVNPNEVARLTPHAAVMPERGRGIHPWMLLDGSCFKADGKVVAALASSPEHLVEICDLDLRLLAQASFIQSFDPNGVLVMANPHNTFSRPSRRQ
jgi:hypothetical protein